MAANSGVQLKDAAIVGGMNEGIEAAILPPEQLAYIENGRIRKPGRLGKRNGYLKVPLTKSARVKTAGPVLDANGALSGKFCGLGDRVCVVNDTAYSFSETKQIWWDQLLSYVFQEKGNGIIPGVYNARAPFGHVSGWRIQRADYTGYQEKGAAAAVCNMDTAYFDGLHWVASENTSASGLQGYIHVEATDPATGRVVYQYQTDGTQPRIMVVGAFLFLAYIDATPQLVTTQFLGYNAAFGRGLSGGAVLAPRITGNPVTATSGFAAAPFSSTQALVAYQSAAGTITLKLLTLSAGDIVIGTTTNYNPAAGGPYYMNLAADPGVGEVLTWRANGTGNVYAREFNTAITAINAEINFGAGFYRPTALYQAPGGFAVLAWNAGPGTINTAYISGGAMTHRMQVTGTWTMVAQPFYVGGQLYAWVEADTETATSFQRYLFLLRIDDPQNGTWIADGPDVTYTPGFELSIQDTLVSYAQDVASGQMWMGKCSPGANGYIFAAPFQRATPGTANNTALRLIQATHFTDTVRRRSVHVTQARGAQVLSGGVPSMFYTTGAYELGFLNAPTLGGRASAAGGAMTPGAKYFYTFVYRWVNPLGETELSAPALAGSITLGGADTQVTLATQAALYRFGNKSGVALDIYRSTGGSVFFYVGTADMNAATYVDQMADTVAAANGVLYTQVGQELENRAPPACRFSCVSQNRLWLGGLPDARTIQSSKAFQKGVAIGFADDDSFRVNLPDACTGIAYMDSVVAFTRNAIYIIGGDGPNNDGSNGWASPVALPFPIGCIDPRSVAVTAEGVWFQSDRGFYMLPRGFGEPAAAGDAAMDQIRDYPICCGSAIVTRGEGSAGSSAESTIRWAMTREETASHGVLFVYDMVHKCWSVDGIGQFTDAGAGGINSRPYSYQNAPAFIATWTDGTAGASGGRMAIALTDTVPQFHSADALPIVREAIPGEGPGGTGFGDETNLPQPSGIYTRWSTGQFRPFGLMGHGEIHRVGVLGYGLTATTISVTNTTNKGTDATALLSVSASAGRQMKEVALGGVALRDVNFVQIEAIDLVGAFGAGEGFHFNGYVVETGQPQGFSNLAPGDRA